MTSKEIQFIWDKNLIKGWELDWKMSGVAYSFIREICPILSKLGDFNRIKNYITSLKLKRCMDKENSSNKIEFCPRQHRAKAFIDIHSRQLTDRLYSETLSNEEILKNIENFKWVRVHWGKINSNKLSRIKRNKKDEVKEKGGIQYTVNARRDKKHDWNTVK